MSRIAQLLQTHAQETQLVLSRANLDDQDAMDIANELKTNTTWEKLVLDNNVITDTGAVALLESIKNTARSKFLGESVEIEKRCSTTNDSAVNSKNDPHSTNGSAVFNKTLTTIDFRGNRLKRRAAEAFRTILPERPIQFSIGDNQLGDDGFWELIQNDFVSLDVTKNCITGKGMSHLKETHLQRGMKLDGLTLSYNPIGDAGAKMLFDEILQTALHHSDQNSDEKSDGNRETTLKAQENKQECAQENKQENIPIQNPWLPKCLKLKSCNLTADAMSSIGNYLQTKHCSLTVLDLSSNQIGDDGIQSLCLYLAQNDSLETLVLDEVGMSDVGLTYIAMALLGNRRLTSLDVRNNSNWWNSFNSILLPAVMQNANIVNLLTGQELSPELKQCIERNIQHKACWSQVSVLTGFTRANRDHPFVNSIQPLLSSIVTMASGVDQNASRNSLESPREFHMGWKRSKLEQYMDTMHFKSHV